MVALDVDQDQNHTQGRYDGACLIFNVINHFILLFFFPSLSVILLPPHTNPQRREIIHGMHPVGPKDCSIDCICRNIRPVHVISVAVIMAVV